MGIRRSISGLRSRRGTAVLVLAVEGLSGARILPMPVGLALPMMLALALALAVHLLLLLLMAMMLAVGVDHAIVMFGVLIEIFGRDSITGRTGVSRERQIFLKHLICIAADADIGTGTVESLRSDRHMRFTAVITATLSLHVWTGSHNT